MFNKDFEILAAARRWDIYDPVHKGLRHAHSQMITRLGLADYAGDLQQLVADLRAHLAFTAKHLGHEETFIHAGLEAAAPGSLLVVNEQHCARLSDMIEALETAERIGLLSGMKAGAPPKAYAAVIESAAQPTSPADDAAELQRLDLAA